MIITEVLVGSLHVDGLSSVRFRLMLVLHLGSSFELCLLFRVMSVAYLGYHFQSNLSNADTEGIERSVRIREVSVYKRSLR